MWMLDTPSKCKIRTKTARHICGLNLPPQSEKAQHTTTKTHHPCRKKNMSTARIAVPIPCHVLSASPEGSPFPTTVVSWGWNPGDPNNVKVEIDADVVPTEDVQAALWMLPRRGPQETGGSPAAFVKWHRVHTKSALHGLYDALTAHGITIEPSRPDALLAWEELMRSPHSHGAVAVSPGSLPNSQAVAQVAEKKQECVPLTAVFAVDEGLYELLHQEDATGVCDDQWINHVWVIGAVLRYPTKLLLQRHAAIGLDVRERLSALYPTPMVRAYRTPDGMLVPLLLWHRAYESRVVALLQEYLHVVHPS